jgi:hypothetical protein
MLNIAMGKTGMLSVMWVIKIKKYRGRIHPWPPKVASGLERWLTT